MLSDLKSKYGTLIKRQQKVEIKSTVHTAVQVGRTVLIMQLRRKLNWGALCRCVHSEKIRPEPIYRLDDNASKDGDIDRSDQNLIRRFNERLVVAAERGNV